MRNISIFVKYIIVGALNTLSYVLITIIFVDLLEFSPLFGSTIGFLFAMVFAFLLNRNWTFKSNTSWLRSFKRYLMISLYGVLINITTMHAVVNIYEGIYYFGLFIAIVLIPTFNYFLMKKWAFC